MIRQYRIQDYSFRLILWVVILSVLGIMVIGSAQASSQRRQIVGLALGIIVMIVISFIDYTWLLKFSFIYYLAGVVLLGAVLLIGENVNGATRWIRIGIQFQPSDLMKIIIIMFFSAFFARFDDRLNTLKIILSSVALIGVTTCALSMLGVKAGSLFGAKYEKKAEILGGVILILLGVKTLLEHLHVL